MIRSDLPSGLTSCTQVWMHSAAQQKILIKTDRWSGEFLKSLWASFINLRRNVCTSECRNDGTERGACDL